MPLYEYHCHSCQETFEVMQKMSDTPLITCSKCGKNTLEKIISATQFQLKGTGWYVTDFKDSGKVKKDTASTPEGSSEKKTEITTTSSDKD